MPLFYSRNKKSQDPRLTYKGAVGSPTSPPLFLPLSGHIPVSLGRDPARLDEVPDRECVEEELPVVDGGVCLDVVLGPPERHNRVLPQLDRLTRYVERTQSTHIPHDTPPSEIRF
ncbi:MAG: hypothetical protein UX74_C0023G0003 [Parcubacteria group bacterium GW2011_GWA2_47_10b]|nr:MAG: hypothetical protein UX74_C0023G0003 [Parcubacteria group bacterium GW2011_GWA2_47_10b]